MEQTKLPDENPAQRVDPTEPVAERDWPKLPRRAQTGKLDRSAFLYDAAKDCYYCPLGRELEFDYVKTQGRDTCEASEYRVYKCHSCAGCGLAADCLRGNSQCRTVSHDQHEVARQKTAARMKTERGGKAYAKRAHLAETPNGFIRRFLQHVLPRGVHKVRYYGLWAPSNRRLLQQVQLVLVTDGSEPSPDDRSCRIENTPTSRPEGETCPHCGKGVLVYMGRLPRNRRAPP